jgi:hypothetical protein
MRKILTSCCLALLMAASDAAAERSSTQGRTVFEFAEKSWAVGALNLGKPLSFRGGKVLAFPSQISELSWAPGGSKPRNVMLVHEVFSDDKDKPFLSEGDSIFAPLLLLPDHSYWRDNLPNTPRHEVAGGRRNVFRGDDIPEAKRVLKAYLTAHDIKGMERWKGQVGVVADALNSPVAVLREDAVQYLAGYPSLARDLSADALPSILTCLRGSAPVDQKILLIDAVAAAGISAAEPGLRELAARDDPTGAAALAGLEKLGAPVAADRLPALAKAKAPEVRAWAATALGKRAESDPASLQAATAMLDDPAEVLGVREGAARGLGASGAAAAAEALGKAVGRGDAASRVAAEALGVSASPDSVRILSDALVKHQGEAAMAAAVGLSQKKACTECSRVLEEQHDGHPDEAVRQLIGVILQVPLEHKH